MNNIGSTRSAVRAAKLSFLFETVLDNKNLGLCHLAEEKSFFGDESVFIDEIVGVLSESNSLDSCEEIIATAEVLKKSEDPCVNYAGYLFLWTAKDKGFSVEPGDRIKIPKLFSEAS